MSDHEPDIVNYMIKFMYTGDYTIEHLALEGCKDAKTETEDNESVEPIPIGTSDFSLGIELKQAKAPADLLIHTAVYLLADEKDIPALKVLATKKYEEILPDSWNSEAFCASLKEIYEGTPENDRMLWDVAIAHAGAHAKDLMDRGEFVTLWKKHGEIGYEMWKAYVKLANLPAPPLMLKPTGCPAHGVEHATFIVKGRKTSYWCQVCRTGFN
ncbi:hypothetical protein BDZ45DRAFT_677425 [Acephala macrosclerotiorum]|nr:hypothetical protein BDZ45DRAFT_677425 [Acephala macrosclerotiorum]